MPPEQLRASDADRERVVEVLREALADGRIDAEEYHERLDTAYAARTLGDLAPLTGDLLPLDAQPIQLRSEPIMAVFRNESRSGRWVVPAGHTTVAAFGTAEIDLREALLTENYVRLDVSSMLGRVVIRVPEGVEVRMRGRTFLGRRLSSARTPELPDAPVLEVTGLSILGSVWVVSPKRKRKWLPWGREK